MNTRNTADISVSVQGLKKSFGTLNVLDGIDFNVKRGEILALLGPNGAGKTTTVRILSTLLVPDGGTVLVNGFDVVNEADQVRSNIGLTGQYAAVDEYLTGEENLQMIGRLYRLSRKDVNRRTSELLELFDLVDAGKRTVKTYSGGMRRRLDLAMSLIASPPVIFLDEPTTGLDPRSRMTLWEIIKQLAATDVTILLTTQYMEEADQLADRIIVIDTGKVIAEGTPNDLKAMVGTDRLEFTIAEASDFEKAKQAINAKALREDARRRNLSVPASGGVGELADILVRLEQAGVKVESVSLHRPTLDDVFLSLTGRSATKENGEEDEVHPKGNAKVNVQHSK